MHEQSALGCVAAAATDGLGQQTLGLIAAGEQRTAAGQAEREVTAGTDLFPVSSQAHYGGQAGAIAAHIATAPTDALGNQCRRRQAAGADGGVCVSGPGDRSGLAKTDFGAPHPHAAGVGVGRSAAPTDALQEQGWTIPPCGVNQPSPLG